MARVPITVMGYRCERCSHEWIPKDADIEPSVCPKCKSPYWNKPRKNARPMTYEAFRDAIRSTIKTRDALTWTEIRTRAKLPQLFPNNKWVHRLEEDIGLKRNRDEHGIIKWTLD
jgi:DNA-directed RNA polymerase subunit RPC12/RpoP